MQGVLIHKCTMPKRSGSVHSRTSRVEYIIVINMGSMENPYK